MKDERNEDERGALILRPETPRRGRFSLVISDSFCFEVSESGDTVRLDFRPRRSGNAWSSGAGNGAYDDAGAMAGPRDGVGVERTVVQGLRGQSRRQPTNADVVEVEAGEYQRGPRRG
jgi:hypothetical protein